MAVARALRDDKTRLIDPLRGFQGSSSRRQIAFVAFEYIDAHIWSEWGRFRAEPAWYDRNAYFPSISTTNALLSPMYLDLPVTSDLQQLIVAVAAISGRSIDEFVIDAVAEMSRRVLAGEAVTVLYAF